MKSRCIATLALWIFLGAMASGQVDTGDQGEATTLDAKGVATRLAEAKARLEGQPAAAGTHGALVRQASERRVELLEEAALLVSDAEAQAALLETAKERRTALDARRAEFEGLAVPEPVSDPTDEGLADAESALAAQRERVSTLRAHEAERAHYADKIPNLLADARKRMQAALEDAARLTQESADASATEEKELLALRAENAALNADVARLKARVLDGERTKDKLLSPILLAERELAERRLERLEQVRDLYTEAFALQLERDAAVLDREVEQLEAALQAAEGPAAQFLARKRLAIARFEQSAQRHEKFLLSLRADLEAQNRRLTGEAEELQSLREYLDKAGTGEQAGDRIKFTMQRVKVRRQTLKRTLSRDINDELGSFRARRIDLEDQLFGAKDDWEAAVESTARALPPGEVRQFRAAARDLFEPFRTALRAEKNLLTTLIGVGQELQVKLIERGDSLLQLETFIRSKVFWIRDAKPLGPERWPRAVAEFAVVRDWISLLGSAETRDALLASVRRPGTLIASLLLLIALPIGLVRARKRLRRIVTRMNDRALREDDTPFKDRIVTVATGIVSVALLPTFFLVTSRLAGIAELPPSIAPVFSALFDHLGFFLFGLFLSRSFFAGRGTAQVQFGMDRDAAHRLHFALRIALWGYLVFHFLRTVLSQPPFLLDGVPLETLPRIAYTVFLIIEVVAGIILLQHRSSFSRFWASTLGDNFVARRWPFFSTLVCVAGVGIVALEIAGYRYSAGVLAKGLVQSLVVFGILGMLYRAVVAIIESIVQRRRAARALLDAESPVSETGEDQAVPRPATGGAGAPGSPEAAAAVTGARSSYPQMRKFLRVLFIIGGVLLIAALWGIDTGAFRALDDAKFYDIRDSGEIDEFVSWLELLKALMYLVGTSYVLKSLPGVYEYAIFPQLDFDAGLKYAVLTISRYTVFTLGVVLSLAAIHLDLSRLAWLMAAIGVGLGFGLQEIVSNFVSGIILLVERPVRVGDVVTIGTTSGKVQRINIRATTVLNFDRQEIIVPNRSLITKEVTNWTRGDTIIRLVVPIGVAYGTDIDQVTELLLETALAQPEVLADPAPQAFFLTHGDSALNFELRVFVPDPSLKIPLLHRINRTINQRLAELGIEIPFPQRDLHIRSSTVAFPAEDDGKETRKRSEKRS